MLNTAPIDIVFIKYFEFSWGLVSVMVETRLKTLEIGEVLSPKKAPDIMVPAIAGSGIFIALPNPINTIPTVLTVPVEVPMSIDIAEDIINDDTRNILSFIIPKL
ncbi:hypothetical protein SDC9_158055 [bioreactor metagenome]|uniref:Uncharacterized protein n=1 Tax=bioreactor metagenome TaxID=1076179 RepID=A0A645F8S9_9ZZZZ